MLKKNALAAVPLLLSMVLPVPAVAQGVIAPPPEGQSVAPQPPAAENLAPRSDGPSAEGAQPRMEGPASVADLAEGLLDAVVNISTSQNVASAGRGAPALDAPDGSPLQELFDDLLQEEGPGSRQHSSLGSGFVIDASGIVVTNNHVIADADEITVNFADGSTLPASIVGVDAKTDLAVLRVKPEEPLASVPFGDSAAVRIGDWVMAIGNPFGLGGSVTVGIVSARGRQITDGPYDDFIQTDAAINRGNSGGPLFDMYGRVIGINTAIISPTGGSIGLGFSIPSALAANVVAQLREFGETRRGWLGIRQNAVSESIAESLGLGEARGALVLGVVPNGPADGRGIEIGDVITGLDGRAVETSRDLPRIVAEMPVGQTVVLELLRKPSFDAPAEEVQVEITLGRLEDGEEMMAASAAQSAPEAGGEPNEPDEDGADVSTLGMRFGVLDDASREEFGISAELNGVLIVDVDARSVAAEEGIEAGQVIVEVGQESIADLDALRARLGDLRSSGQRNALMLIGDPDGDLRFVVVPLS